MTVKSLKIDTYTNLLTLRRNDTTPSYVHVMNVFNSRSETVERANRTGLNFSVILIIHRPNCKIDRLSLIKEIRGF